MSKTKDHTTGAGCAFMIAIVAIATGIGFLGGTGVGFIALGAMFFFLVLA